MTDSETDQILKKHGERLDAVEGKLSSHEAILDAMSRDIIAIRTEASVRADAQSQGMERLSADIKALTVQLAESTGAQKEQSRIAERNLQNWRKIAIIVGIFCTLGAAVGSTLLSDQEVASTIWTKWLHIQEPWDNTQTGASK